MTTTSLALAELGATLKSQKCNMTTANIYDGVQERFDNRGSLTPKQASWVRDNLEKLGIAIPADFKRYIEIPGTETQKAAYDRVTAGLIGEDINDRAVEDLLNAAPIQHTHDDLVTKEELERVKKVVVELYDMIADLQKRVDK